MQDKPQIIKGGNISIDENYRSWLQSLKSRLQQYQIKAAVRVNSAMLEFYWELGRDIVAMKPEHLWGAGIINQLSLDLKEMFPNQTGFSVTNLKYMKRWYAFYSQSVIIRHQVGDELEKILFIIPWRHHVEIFTRAKSLEEALFFIEKTKENGWSRCMLVNMMKTKFFETHGNTVNNFTLTMPKNDSEYAKQILKDTYKLDFVSLREDYEEKDLHKALETNLTKFLLELGKGFAFVGSHV